MFLASRTEYLEQRRRDKRERFVNNWQASCSRSRIATEYSESHPPHPQQLSRWYRQGSDLSDVMLMPCFCGTFRCRRCKWSESPICSIKSVFTSSNPPYSSYYHLDRASPFHQPVCGNGIFNCPHDVLPRPILHVMLVRMWLKNHDVRMCCIDRIWYLFQATCPIYLIGKLYIYTLQYFIIELIESHVAVVCEDMFYDFLIYADVVGFHYILFSLYRLRF